jgi:hypothetical protein
MIKKNARTPNIGSQTMRVSEGLQAQWHAFVSIATGQRRDPHSRTVSSRKRLACMKSDNFGIEIFYWIFSN